MFGAACCLGMVSVFRCLLQLLVELFIHVFPSPFIGNREGSYRIVIQLHLVPIVRRHFACVGHQVEAALHIRLTFIAENILDTYRAYEFVERIEENVAVRKVFPR